MGYWVSHIFAIRTSGVTGGMDEADYVDFRARLRTTIDQLAGELERSLKGYNDIDWDQVDWDRGFPSLSQRELSGHKGGYMVIAGIFSAWMLDSAVELARRLSVAIETHVLYLGWDEENGDHRWHHFDEGKDVTRRSRSPLASPTPRAAAATEEA